MVQPAGISLDWEWRKHHVPFRDLNFSSVGDMRDMERTWMPVMTRRGVECHYGASGICPRGVSEMWDPE